MNTSNIPSGFFPEDFELYRLPEYLHESAIACMGKGDVEAFLLLASSADRMNLLIENEEPLRGLAFTRSGCCLRSHQ